MTQTPQADLEISITRTFRASPERVFDAWTDPAKLAQWFGPDGFTTTTHAFDLRPGGTWRHTMRGPDGTEYPNEIVFVEVERASRIVYDHVSPPPFRTTVTFAPEGAGTRMSFRMKFPDADAYRVAVDTYGAKQGLEQTVAHLAAFVDGAPASSGVAQPSVTGEAIPGGFTIERMFKAPPEKVWEMWTTEAGLMKWWALSAKDMGYDFRVLRLDVRQGGGFAFEMKNKAMTLVNRGTYTLVQPHRELDWTWHFDIFLAPDQKPYDVPISVSLERLANGGTHMRFTQGPLASPQHTEGSRQGVMANFEKMAKALGE